MAQRRVQPAHFDRTSRRLCGLSHAYVNGVGIAYADIVVFPRAKALLSALEAHRRSQIEAAESDAFVTDVVSELLRANSNMAALTLQRQEHAARQHIAEFEYLVEAVEPADRVRLQLTAAHEEVALSHLALTLHHRAVRDFTASEELLARAALALDLEVGAVTVALTAAARDTGLGALESAESAGRVDVRSKEVSGREELLRECAVGAALMSLRTVSYEGRNTLCMAEEACCRVAIEQAWLLQLESETRVAVEREHALFAARTTIQMKDASASHDLVQHEETSRNDIAAEACEALLFTVPRHDDVFLSTDEGGLLCAPIGDDPTFWGWSMLARQTVVVDEYFPAMFPLLEQREALSRGDIAAMELAQRKEHERDHLNQTVGIAIDMTQLRETRERLEVSDDEAWSRRRLHEVEVESHRVAETGTLEWFARTNLLTAMALSSRAAMVSEARLWVHYSVCAQHFVPLIVSSEEGACRRALMLAQHRDRSLQHYREALRQQVVPLLRDHAEPLARRALSDAEAEARSLMTRKAAVSRSVAVSAGLYREALKVHRDVARTEQEEFVAILLHCHSDWSKLWWATQLREALRTIVERGYASIYSATVRSETRVLQSRYKLLVIEDRQNVMRQEHAEYCHLRELRDFLASEREARQKVRLAEAEARDILSVKESVWRASGGVSGPDLENGIIESPQRRRQKESTSMHPNAIRNRERYRSAQRLVANPRYEATTAAPDMRWLQTSFTPPPLVKRFEDDPYRSAARSVSPAFVNSDARGGSLHHVLAASKAAMGDHAHDSPRRIAALRRANPTAESQLAAAMHLEEAEARSEMDHCEASDWASLVAFHRAVEMRCATDLRRIKLSGIAKTLGKAIEQDEAKRRSAIDFERERDVVLFALELRPPAVAASSHHRTTTTVGGKVAAAPAQQRRLAPLAAAPPKRR